MKGVHDFISELLNLGITDAQLEVLAHSQAQLQVVVKQIHLANKNFEEKGKATKRQGRRSPSTVRGVDAPAPPEVSLQKVGKLVSPTNPTISNAKPEPIEPAPHTLHAASVAKEMAKINGANSASADLTDDLAPPTKVDPGRLKRRQRVATPTSLVESSPNDSVPSPLDPIVPVLGAMGAQTVQKLTEKQERRKSVKQGIRSSVVVAPK